MKKKRDDDNTQRPLWGVRGVKGGVAAHPRGGTGSAPVGFFLPFKIQTFVFFFFFIALYSLHREALPTPPKSFYDIIHYEFIHR